MFSCHADTFQGLSSDPLGNTVLLFQGLESVLSESCRYLAMWGCNQKSQCNCFLQIPASAINYNGMLVHLIPVFYLKFSVGQAILSVIPYIRLSSWKIIIYS